MIISKCKKWALDVLFPRRCPICHDVAMPRGSLACPSCAKALVPIKEPRCMRCSKELRNPSAEYCHDCQINTHHYNQGLGIFPYTQKMRESISKYKYHGRREYGRFFAMEMMRYGADKVKRWAPQVIIPVPIHKRRKRKRGFNQAEEMAYWIGRWLQIPMDTGLVIRHDETAPQNRLGRQERKKNLQKAFELTMEQSPYSRILIIDDIYTTGSTLDAVGKCLKDGGTGEVYFLTLCIGEGY